MRRKFITGKLGSRNFNPRTHVGCDIKWIDKFHLIFISIHAPTWGATSFAENKHIRVIFQSTHPRGVRRPAVGVHTYAIFNFNPRTHVGCDVSKKDITPRTEYFNPRTHVGCDVNVTNKQDTIGLFQSTHPRGVRPCLSGDCVQ